MQEGFRFYRDAPATKRFLKFTAKWSPGWPRRLLRLAAKRHVTVDVPDYFEVLSAGFAGWPRAWRILRALNTVLEAGHGRPRDPGSGRSVTRRRATGGRPNRS
jgi:hypothetical protein